MKLQALGLIVALFGSPWPAAAEDWGGNPSPQEQAEWLKQEARLVRLRDEVAALVGENPELAEQALRYLGVRKDVWGQATEDTLLWEKPAVERSAKYPWEGDGKAWKTRYADENVDHLWQHTSWIKSNMDYFEEHARLKGEGGAQDPPKITAEGLAAFYLEHELSDSRDRRDWRGPVSEPIHSRDADWLAAQTFVSWRTPGRVKKNREEARGASETAEDPLSDPETGKIVERLRSWGIEPTQERYAGAWERHGEAAAKHRKYLDQERDWMAQAAERWRGQNREGWEARSFGGRTIEEWLEVPEPESKSEREEK